MDKRVVFATCHDGVRVAAGVSGAGFPMLSLHGPLFSHCHLPPFTEAVGEFRNTLAGRRALVMADLRGSGLADRGRILHSFDDYMADLLAIYDALGIQEADILAQGARPSLAIRFAGCFPDRVRRLYLWGGTAGPTAASGYSTLSPARNLVADDWDLFVDTLIARGLGSEALIPTVSPRMRKCASQEDVLRWMDCLAATNIDGDGVRVRCPTLICELNTRTLREASRVERLAAEIPRSELVFVSRWEELPEARSARTSASRNRAEATRWALTHGTHAEGK
jgi:pimeloyl-ACP methyl ester carboxylesterase